MLWCWFCGFFFFQAEDGIRDGRVTGVQTCALPICMPDGMTWWSVDNALRLMDDNGIRMAMLSPMPRLPANARLIRLMTALRDGPTGRTKPVRELIRTGFRRANQLAADVASARPERFGFYAVLGLVNGDDAVKEAAYAYDVLGADGVLLTTNVGPVYLGDEAFEPLFAE